MRKRLPENVSGSLLFSFIVPCNAYWRCRLYFLVEMPSRR
ncbi:hypothetical protein HMPREF9371_0715 [Neisseria shayeganii 871]|uniref:Uncharacterized protein n=1 Tax=Neisseria shayeganii 871 TaxID=1032488 RepID=G4CGH6_9NEIS|nr:hypothetical protein HMPREF9371_0715 [Neisseria shayeganii 871]